MQTAKALLDDLINDNTGSGIDIPWDGTEEDAVANIIVIFFGLDPFVGASDPRNVHKTRGYKALVVGVIQAVSEEYANHPELITRIQLAFGDGLDTQETLNYKLPKNPSDAVNIAIVAFLYLCSLGKEKSDRLIRTLDMWHQNINREIEAWDKFSDFLQHLADDVGALGNSRKLITG